METSLASFALIVPKSLPTGGGDFSGRDLPRRLGGCRCWKGNRRTLLLLILVISRCYRCVQRDCFFVVSLPTWLVIFAGLIARQAQVMAIQVIDRAFGVIQRGDTA